MARKVHDSYAAFRDRTAPWSRVSIKAVLEASDPSPRESGERVPNECEAGEGHLVFYPALPYIGTMHSVIETQTFLKDAAEAGVTEEERLSIVNLIAADPTQGDLMTGTGGVRKARVARRGARKGQVRRVSDRHLLCGRGCPGAAPCGDQQGRARQPVKG